MTHCLFLGDSVTDCSRKRASRFEHTSPALGKGWVSFVAKKLKARSDAYVFWNRGYAGSLTSELRDQPDWWPENEDESISMDLTTLMIGINDVWHPFWKAKPHDIERVLIAFRETLQHIQPLTSKLIVMEPVALPVGEVTDQWWAPLDELVAGQQAIVNDLGLHWLSLQEELMRDAGGRFDDYLHDGVHPTDLGHRWLSTQWLNYVLEKQLIHE